MPPNWKSRLLGIEIPATFTVCPQVSGDTQGRLLELSLDHLPVLADRLLELVRRRLVQSKATPN